MYMLFKPDGSLKITINTLDGVEKKVDTVGDDLPNKIQREQDSSQRSLIYQVCHF